MPAASSPNRTRLIQLLKVQEDTQAVLLLADDPPLAYQLLELIENFVVANRFGKSLCLYGILLLGQNGIFELERLFRPGIAPLELKLPHPPLHRDGHLDARHCVLLDTPRLRIAEERHDRV